MLRLLPLALALAAPSLGGCAATGSQAVTDVSTADRIRASQAARPVSDEAARAAVEARLQNRFAPAAATSYAHGSLVNSVLVTGSGAKLAGWFMCGTVGANDAPPQTYLAQFDPAQGTEVVGSFLDRGDSHVVAGWCQQVRRNDLAALPAPAATPGDQAAVPRAADADTCRSGGFLCSFGRALRFVARAIGLGPRDEELEPLATAEPKR